MKNKKVELYKLQICRRSRNQELVKRIRGRMTKAGRQCRKDEQNEDSENGIRSIN
jgi:hypothetical protein